MKPRLANAPNLFLQLGMQDEQTQMILAEIGDAFADDHFSTDKTPEEWLHWLVKSISDDWKLAQKNGTPKEEFIPDYVAEMSKKFAGAKGKKPITAEQIEMAVRAIVR